MDRLRVKNEKLSELEQEQKLKNDDLQRKAMQQLQENEEEIKRLNQVISFIISYTHTQLVAWHSGRTSVSGRRTFPVLRSTCS